jgi:hypothetical protein
MDAPFQVSVKSSKVTVKFEQLPDEIRGELRTTVDALDAELLSLTRSRAASLFKVRSGAYVASFRGSVRQSASRISGSVHSHARQAQIFEWGGTVPAHDILPDRAQALAFMMSAGQVFAAIVHHPAFSIAGEQVAHGALEDMQATIVSEISGTVREAVARD